MSDIHLHFGGQSGLYAIVLLKRLLAPFVKSHFLHQILFHANHVHNHMFHVIFRRINLDEPYLKQPCNHDDSKHSLEYSNDFQSILKHLLNPNILLMYLRQKLLPQHRELRLSWQPQTSVHAIPTD